MKSAATATVALATWVLIIAAGSATGQKDAQKTFEPRSSPGAGQRSSRSSQGTGASRRLFILGRRAQPCGGQCHQFMIHDGRFLQSDFVFQEGGKKTTGLGIIGFEPESGTFTSFWTNSRRRGCRCGRARNGLTADRSSCTAGRSTQRQGRTARRQSPGSRTRVANWFTASTLSDRAARSG